MSPVADIITIEIGSTVTKVIAISLSGSSARIIARADSLTTPQNIMTGLRAALDALESRSGIGSAKQTFASSSAAGGLRMTVHGLTRELTARAAEEATLGAGANVKLLTAGKLTDRHIEKIEQIRPNLIMLAGGVDFGEEDVILHNAAIIAATDFDAPVIYAGNASIHDEIRELFSSGRHELYIVENVYPSFNELRVEPVREIIQRIFSERLIIAPGMEELRELAQGHIVPVPAACLQATELLSTVEGNVVVVDVGGATTDVHSVIQEPLRGNIDPHLKARRTVEGDLGLFVSAESVWQKTLGRKGTPTPLRPIPESVPEKKVSLELAQVAVEHALRRHAGAVIHGAYSADGSQAVRGRDLRNTSLIVGTGGGTTKITGAFEQCKNLFNKYKNDALLPSPEVRIAIDSDYIFSACGTFAALYPESALLLMQKSMQLL